MNAPSSTHAAGQSGEAEVVQLIECPNCGKALMLLPKNYPLFDVQCTGCSFRAQVKTNNSKPKTVIFGAGWDVIDKVLKSGYSVPPLLANFKWSTGGVSHQEIRFYPFIPRKSLKKYTLSATAKRANYRMFRYDLQALPYMTLFES